MIKLQPSLFEGARMTMREAIDLSLASLTYYGAQYKHWCIAYSGGKDSSATVSFVVWAIPAWLARFRGTPNYPILATLPMFKALTEVPLFSHLTDLIQE